MEQKFMNFHNKILLFMFENSLNYINNNLY